MRRTATLLFSVFLTVFLSVGLVGCDETPTSVEDFEIQPNLELSSESVTFIAGQSPNPTVKIVYQGLDEVPTMSASASELAVEKVDETGTPENGSQTWSMEYTSTLEQNTVEGSVTVTAPGNGDTIETSLPVQVNNPVSVFEEFESSFALVADYETGYQDGTEEGAGIQYDVEASGASTAEIVSDEFAANSNGDGSLAVDASAGDPVTVLRSLSAPESNVFSFLLKPDPNTDFVLTLGFTEETSDGTKTWEIDVPVSSGTEWRKIDLAVGELFADFNPVAQRAGGNGPLKEVTMTTDQDVAFNVDQMTMGTTERARAEVHDFQTTSYAYGGFSEIEFGTTDDLAASSSGTVARTMAWTDGGNYFGYNYDLLRPNLDGQDEVALYLGNVNRAFTLYVFVETPEGAGGYAYGAGKEVSIEPAEGWQQVTVPVSDLGDDPSALKDPGIKNVGFEIRRAPDDDSGEEINFAIDDIRLQPGS